MSEEKRTGSADDRKASISTQKSAKSASSSAKSVTEKELKKKGRKGSSADSEERRKESKTTSVHKSQAAADVEESCSKEVGTGTDEGEDQTEARTGRYESDEGEQQWLTFERRGRKRVGDVAYRGYSRGRGFYRRYTLVN